MVGQDLHCLEEVKVQLHAYDKHEGKAEEIERLLRC